MWTEPEPPQWTHLGRALVAILFAGVATIAAVTIPGAAMAATCAQPGTLIGSVPWAQSLLKPEQVWPYTKGGGVTVAVLDSGVDASSTSLGGHVTTGFDAVAGKGPANTDCIGTGTQVAAIIAARPMDNVGFAGLAPGVTILPIRVIADGGFNGSQADPGVLARGITAAVDRGADVIVVSAITYVNTPALADAVADAIKRDVTVVAAAGDLGDAQGLAPTPYPANYPGVIGVGALGMNGQRWGKSQQGTYVHLVAPGDQLITRQAGGGMVLVSGTGFAAAFVGATVALVRSKKGTSIHSNEIEPLLAGTTTPTPGGPGYGYGLVNPLAAVNNQVSDSGPIPLPRVAVPGTDATSASVRSRNVAIAGAALAMVMVFLIVLGAVTMPRGRRRFWRSILTRPAEGSTEPDEPGPPLPLFEEAQTR